MTKLSVIVPVYNAEKTIRNCVESIQNQKCHDIEIILVNDGSRDRSLDICMEMAQNDNRIIVLDGENAGVSVARNRGMSKAIGEYIAFVDADDSVESMLYTEMFTVAEKHNTPIVFCNYREVNKSGGEKNVDQITAMGEEVVKSIKVINQLISISETALFGVVWRSIFKRNIIIENCIEFTPKLTMAEDLQFLLKYLACVDSVGLCLSYLYNFKVSVQSTTGNYMKNHDKDMKYVNDWMLNYVKETLKDEDLLTNVHICIANTMVLNIANVCKHGTPYGLLERLKYAEGLAKLPYSKHALKVSLRHENHIVRKRRIQLKLLNMHLGCVNVLFHSIKNKTLLERQ